MEFDRGELGSEERKGEVLQFVKTEVCIDIPEWLLWEVLIRLPVKLVFRYKLVCKQWLSVITDPSFARMYVSRASLLPQLQNWTFIYSNMHVEGKPEYELLEEDVYSRDLKCPLYMLRCPCITYPCMKQYKIVGVSNGLVLYDPCEKVGNQCIYTICNPITGLWISLPPYPYCVEFEKIGFLARVENGFLSSYRVVRLDVPLKRSNAIKIIVFLSESSEWKDFDVYTEQEIFGVTLRNPIALNEILHWITCRHGIMAYDPYKNPDSLRFIALPRDVDPKSNDELKGIPSLCDAHQGYLRYLDVCDIFRVENRFFSIGIWILNDYSTGDWCLQHRISSTDILYDVLLSKIQFLIPISFHPFDPEIVFLEFDNIIVSLNIKTRKLESHGGVFRNRKYFWWWTFLFVIPPWPTSIVQSSFN